MKVRDYMHAVSIKSLKGLTDTRDIFLVWLAHINELLPYELRLGDSDVIRLAYLLADIFMKGEKAYLK